MVNGWPALWRGRPVAAALVSAVVRPALLSESWLGSIRKPAGRMAKLSIEQPDAPLVESVTRMRASLRPAVRNVPATTALPATKTTAPRLCALVQVLLQP